MASGAMSAAAVEVINNRLFILPQTAPRGKNSPRSCDWARRRAFRCQTARFGAGFRRCFILFQHNTYGKGESDGSPP